MKISSQMLSILLPVILVLLALYVIFYIRRNGFSASSIYFGIAYFIGFMVLADLVGLSLFFIKIGLDNHKFIFIIVPCIFLLLCFIKAKGFFEAAFGIKLVSLNQDLKTRIITLIRALVLAFFTGMSLYMGISVWFDKNLKNDTFIILLVMTIAFAAAVVMGFQLYKLLKRNKIF